MAIEITTPTDEQVQQEKTNYSEAHKSVMDALKGDRIQNAILNDLGLPPETEEEKPKVKAPVKEVEEPAEEPVEEPVEEEATEETTETPAQEDEEESEEVIPKSKVQRRFDELTARLKAQERELAELKSSKESPKDEVTKQLESMTADQLKAAKAEVRRAQFKAQDNDAKLNELMELEDKIDSAMQQGPAKFQKAQQEAYVRAAEEISMSGAIKNMEKAAPEIIKIANEIYADTPSFQKDVNGQASALKLAVRHYNAVNSVPGDKSKETDLKRQVNNLKRKTTLDTKSGKVNADKARLDSIEKAAMRGNLKQKIDFVSNHPAFNVDNMIPDEYK